MKMSSSRSLEVRHHISVSMICLGSSIGILSNPELRDPSANSDLFESISLATTIPENGISGMDERSHILHCDEELPMLLPGEQMVLIDDTIIWERRPSTGSGLPIQYRHTPPLNESMDLWIDLSQDQEKMNENTTLCMTDWDDNYYD